MEKKDKNIHFKNKIDAILNFYRSNKYDEVIARTKPLLKKFPKVIFFYNILSLAYNAKEEYEKGIEILNQAIKIEPKNVLVLNNLGLIHSNLNNLETAENYLERALKIKENYLEASINLGNVKLELNKNVEAIRILTHVLDENKNNYFLNFTLGNAYQQSGYFEKSKKYFDKCLKINPNNTTADKSISLMIKYNKDHEHLKNMEAKLNHSLSTQNQMFLNFALGKAYEDCGNFKTSFICYKKANDIKNKLVNFNLKKENEFFIKLKNLFLNTNLQLENTQNKNNKVIIFVLGMPRSGTSLVEQILSSHKKIYGAGELSYITDLVNKKFQKNIISFTEDKIDNYPIEYFDDLKIQYLNNLKKYNFKENYLVDKAPLNFKWIGFILKALPNSKIIHCNRDPMDICWSNYKNFFSSKKLNFSYNFRNLGEYYKLYFDLMQFWNTLYKDKIYNFSYESLINNTEEETKKLINYCELEWDENCLNFYKNKKNVSTASLAQVRKPIYKSSIKSWHNYSKELDELKKILNL